MEESSTNISRSNDINNAEKINYITAIDENNIIEESSVTENITSDECVVNGCDIISIQDDQTKSEDNKNVTENPRKRDSVNTNNTGILSKCGSCDLPASKKRKDVLYCHKCNGLVHFNCSRLPIYMLFSYSTSSKKYVCEDCSIPTEDFLED